MQHKRTNEKERNHQIRPNTYPINELCSEVAIHVSRDCSSNEMRIADNRLRVLANDDVKFLQNISIVN